MYSPRNEFFMTMEFLTVDKDLWKQVFNKPEHHLKRKELGITYCGFSSNRKDKNHMNVMFKYNTLQNMNTHKQTIAELIEKNRDKWSALGDLDSIVSKKWKTLCERTNDVRFNDILNKTDDIIWFAEHNVDNKTNWINAMQEQQESGHNFDTRWWGLMENVDDPNKVACSFRFPRDRLTEFLLNFTESLSIYKDMAGIDINTCNINFLNLEWETIYNMPDYLINKINDKDTITNIICDIVALDNNGQPGGREHMADNCLFIRPTGNPLNMKQWDDMINSPSVKVNKSELLSINKLEISDNMAYVCYTTHSKFVYHGKENDDVSVLTAILKQIAGKWKVIHGQRSTGRKPTEELPEFD